MDNENWIIEYEPITYIVSGFYPPDYTGELPTKNFVKIPQAERDEVWAEVVQHPMCYDPVVGGFKQYMSPPPSFEELKASKKADIAAARYDYEIAGVIINGIHITTDREDQAMITAVALSAVVDQTYTTVWKGADGYLTLNAAEILAMARIVGAHVEAAFAEEKRLAALIDAAQDEAELASISWTLT